jgi:hypothetical protein
LKRKWILVLVICIFGFFTAFHLNTTKALNKPNKDMPEFTYSSKEKNQIFGYFMLELYRDDIMSAINEFYKNDKITGYNTPDPPHYDMVSIPPFEKGVHYKGLENRYTYLLKIKLLPSGNKGKILGADTLYFAVSPYHHTMENPPKDFPGVELVKYEHSEPSS